MTTEILLTILVANKSYYIYLGIATICKTLQFLLNCSHESPLNYIHFEDYYLTLKLASLPSASSEVVASTANDEQHCNIQLITMLQSANM